MRKGGWMRPFLKNGGGAKAERNEKSLMFRYLTDLGNHCNMFYQQLKIRGRPPSGYTQLDPKQLALSIPQTLPKK